MKFHQKLNSHPKTWKSFIFYWCLLPVLLFLVTIGYFVIGRSLAYGVISVPNFEGFIGILSQGNRESIPEVVPTEGVQPIQTPAPRYNPEAVLATWD